MKRLVYRFCFLFLVQVHEKFNRNAVHLLTGFNQRSRGNREFIWHCQTTLANFYENTWFIWIGLFVCLFLLLFLAQVHEKFDCDAMHLFMSIDFINGGNREFIRHLQTTLADFYENTWFIWSCKLDMGNKYEF